MAWTVKLEQLRKDRDRTAAALEDRRNILRLDAAAHARLWLDELEQARSEFSEAVEDQRRRLRERNREATVDVLSHWGGLLWLAGRRDEARVVLGQAVNRGLHPHTEAEVRYLLGDDEGALDMAARSERDQPFPPIVAALVRARRDGDAEQLAWARERIVRIIRKEKHLPAMDQGDHPIGLYDWLEETFRLEGEPVPSHLEMLERAELLAR
jgi:hypothetical protein